MSESLESQLERLLRDLELPSVSSTTSRSGLTLEDLKLVTEGLVDGSVKGSPANKDSRDRSRALAFIVLARTLAVPGIDQASIIDYVSQNLDDDSLDGCYRSLSLLGAVFQVDATWASSILQSSGIVDAVKRVMESQRTGFPGSGKPDLQAFVDHAMADFLSNALNASACRPIVRSLSYGWLNDQVRSGIKKDLKEPAKSLRYRTQIACAVSLTKIARVEAADPLLSDSNPALRSGTAAWQDSDSANMFMEAVRQSDILDSQGLDRSSLSLALEGLAYISSQPELKVRLCSDPGFIQALFRLPRRLSGKGVPTSSARTSNISASYNVDDTDESKVHRGDVNSLAYGISAILVSLFSRQPNLTSEQKQIKKLKQIASAGKAKQPMGKTASEANDPDDDPRNSNEAVEARIKSAIEQGLVNTLVDLGKTESVQVRSLVGKIYLEVVEDPTNRIAVVQDGGFKGLNQIIAGSLSDYNLTGKDAKSALQSLSSDALLSIQAMAKINITLAPTVLYGVHPLTKCLDSIRPIAILLLHPSSTLLQRFEAMMALTNLASIDPTVANRIAGISNAEVVRQAEQEMLEDNTLVRRAAVELICNLLASEAVFNRYSGDLTDKDSPEKGVTARLHILLAMADVEDLNTRLAASGALAGITESPTACRHLLNIDGREEKAFAMIYNMLSPPIAESEIVEEVELEISTLAPNLSLLHRALVILVNLMSYVSNLLEQEKMKALQAARNSELPQRLLELLTAWTGPNATGRPSKEVLDLTIQCLLIFKAQSDTTK
jgi:hypothetical protein